VVDMDGMERRHLSWQRGASGGDGAVRGQGAPGSSLD